MVRIFYINIMYSFYKPYKVEKGILYGKHYFHWINDDKSGTKYYYKPECSVTALEAFRCALRESKLEKKKDLGLLARRSI